MSAALSQLNQDRRQLADEIQATARRVWLMGRSDRIAGYPMAIAWRDDPVYRAGYDRERRQEVVASVAA